MTFRYWRRFFIDTSDGRLEVSHSKRPFSILLFELTPKVRKTFTQLWRRLEKHLDRQNWYFRGRRCPSLQIYTLFGCRNLGDYPDVFLRTDVLILADVFEKYEKVPTRSSSLLLSPQPELRRNANYYSRRFGSTREWFWHVVVFWETNSWRY